MKISIITTVYQAEKDLPRLLDSMMAQKSPELEFFLIDNGSPDRCGEICREYAERDSRFRVFTLEENIGYIRARNLGIREVDADYVGFCDSDDFLEPGGYDRAIERIKDTNCDLYITSYYTVSENNSVACRVPYSVGLYSDEQIKKDILPQAFGSLPGKPVLHGFAWKQIFRRSIFTEKELMYLPQLQPYEDQILNIDFVTNSDLIYIDDNILYNYIVNTESITAKIAQNYDPLKEWERLRMFYKEKQHRITSETHCEALSNQMLGFLYALCLNAAKQRNVAISKLSRELNNCIDNSIVVQMLANASKNTNPRDRFVRYCLINGQYRILLTIMRLGIRIRG